jgi:arginyl-tRNA synthetase
VSSGSAPVDGLRKALLDAAAALRDGNGDMPNPTLERPPRAEFGDYSSNVAMLLAPALRSAPREIAERVGGELRTSMGPVLERVEVAGPGFLNIFLTDSWFCAAVQAIRDEGQGFGSGVVAEEQRERILLEFVSANPTGPITVASGRHAAFGDSLARTLAFAGHEVEREYYVNDYGTQVELFGRSIAASMTGDELPEGGYQGDYIGELARQVEGEGLDPADISAISRRGVELIVEQARTTLERFRVTFDSWFSEHQLQDQGKVDAVIDQLKKSGHVYESEGATWFRTTELGDDKDRVLRRSSGDLTYFGTDIAYHENKLGRGLDRLINMLGADHHGYVGRIKAAYEALGGDRDRIEVIIMQLVNVVERGERAQMSKRRGEFVTLDELLDDIGVDAARHFMLQRSSDTALDVDLDLAREKSQENPVYYVQYAHARIGSILRKAGGELMSQARQADFREFVAELQPAERALVKRLLEFPEEVREAAERRAPHRLVTYVHEVASDFHAFYRDCRVVGAEPAELEQLRVSICIATRDVIARALGLLGVEAPEQM